VCVCVCVCGFEFNVYNILQNYMPSSNPDRGFLPSLLHSTCTCTVA